MIVLKNRWLTMFSFIICLVSLCGSASTETEGLVARWRMDKLEDGVVKDDSGNGHDAVFASKVKGFKPEFVEGLTGMAMKFERAKMMYLTVKDSAAFNFKDHLTIMAWVKPSKDMSRRSGEIFCKSYDVGEKKTKSGGWRLRCGWSMFFFRYTTKEGKNVQWKSPASTAPIGSWSHITVTFNGKTVRYYSGGVEKLAVSGKGDIKPVDNPLIIGNYLGTKRPYAFDGLLDEVKVFNRALTKDEIWKEALPDEK